MNSEDNERLEDEEFSDGNEFQSDGSEYIDDGNSAIGYSPYFNNSGFGNKLSRGPHFKRSNDDLKDDIEKNKRKNSHNKNNSNSNGNNDKKNDNEHIGKNNNKNNNNKLGESDNNLASHAGGRRGLFSSYRNKSSESRSKGKIKKSLTNVFRLRIIIFVVIAFFVLFLFLFVFVGASYIVLDKIKSAEESNSEMYGSNIATAYTECKGIMIKGSSKVLPLEDYIAGVVSGESYPKGIEALKAQAIAARTFALWRTDNCKKSIVNSQAAQVYNANIRDDAREATNATAGLVLTYNGEIFMTQYDSFKGRCSGGTCSATYVRQPKNETHVVSFPSSGYISMVAGGHGHGMSQVASYYMADQGKTYEEILKFFYSDGVQISKLSPSESGSINGSTSGVAIRTSAPVKSDKYFNSPYVGSHNIGQCVWYVKGRAQEILSFAKMDESSRSRAIKAVQNTSGNGTQWWNNSSLSIFGSSNDYKKPKAGSIIVWKYSESRRRAMGGQYGHVAILESVSSDGHVVVTEGWNSCNGAHGASSWNCVGFKNRSFNSLDSFYSWVANYGNAANYEFLGYVYLLG